LGGCRGGSLDGRKGEGRRDCSGRLRHVANANARGWKKEELLEVQKREEREGESAMRSDKKRGREQARFIGEDREKEKSDDYVIGASSIFGETKKRKREKGVREKACAQKGGGKLEKKGRDTDSLQLPPSCQQKKRAESCSASESDKFRLRKIRKKKKTFRRGKGGEREFSDFSAI